MIDDILAILIGADVGLQERANRQMRERGIEPTFWQRHPMLPYVIGAVLGPFIVIALGAGIILYAAWVTQVDADFGNTSLIDIFGLIVLPIWLIRTVRGIRYRRRNRRPGTALIRRG